MISCLGALNMSRLQVQDIEKAARESELIFDLRFVGR